MNFFFFLNNCVYFSHFVTFAKRFALHFLRHIAPAAIVFCSFCFASVFFIVSVSCKRYVFLFLYDFPHFLFVVYFNVRSTLHWRLPCCFLQNVSRHFLWPIGGFKTMTACKHRVQILRTKNVKARGKIHPRNFHFLRTKIQKGCIFCFRFHWIISDCRALFKQDTVWQDL